MKKFVSLMVLVFVVLMVSAQNNWTVSYYGYMTMNSSFVPSVSVYSSHKINDKLSYTAFGLTNGKWGEVYSGFEYAVSKSVVVGLSAGVEVAKDPWRVGACVLILRPKFEFVNFVEYGGSGYWYDSRFKVKMKKFHVGTMVRRFAGAGLRLDVPASKTFNLWCAGMYTSGELLGRPAGNDWGGMLGVSMKF